VPPRSRPTSDSSALARLRALGPVAIGVATEVFAEREWPALVACAVDWSRAAVELSALNAADLDSIAAFLRRSPPQVPYLSLHAPVALERGGEERLVARLAEIRSCVAAIVQHPHLVQEPAAFATMGDRLVLENMDARKDSGRDVAELAPYFDALPEAGFCLDVAHVKTIDPELKLAHELLDRFGTRLRELHVSGIDGDCNHVSLTIDAVESYADVLRRSRHVPWILESLPDP
jgi:hypothetical protein